MFPSQFFLPQIEAWRCQRLKKGAALWNTVHCGLRVADSSHRIQLENQTHAMLIPTLPTTGALCKNIGKFNDNYFLFQFLVICLAPFQCETMQVINQLLQMSREFTIKYVGPWA